MRSSNENGRSRRLGARLAIVAALAGAGLWLGTAPSQADHNYCHNFTFDDRYAEINGIGVGVDLGTSPLGFWMVCVNETSIGLEARTAGEVTLSVWNCNNGLGSCVAVLNRTGIVYDPNRNLTISVVPLQVDTAYDLYIDGRKVAEIAYP